MKANFYSFNQNNSGGTFDVDDNVSHNVIIEAKSEKEAIEKFEPMIENQSGSCPCCGDRWSLYTDKVDLEHYKKTGYPVSVYNHYKDYKGRYNAIYGAFKHIEKPSLKTKSWGEEYSGVVKFKNIEEYAQLMANRYGCCKPDIIIHYANGTKKEVFKTELPENLNN